MKKLKAALIALSLGSAMFVTGCGGDSSDVGAQGTVAPVVQVGNQNNVDAATRDYRSISYGETIEQLFGRFGFPILDERNKLIVGYGGSSYSYYESVIQWRYSDGTIVQVIYIDSFLYEKSVSNNVSQLAAERFFDLGTYLATGVR